MRILPIQWLRGVVLLFWKRAPSLRPLSSPACIRCWLVPAATKVVIRLTTVCARARGQPGAQAFCCSCARSAESTCAMRDGRRESVQSMPATRALPTRVACTPCERAVPSGRTHRPRLAPASTETGAPTRPLSPQRVCSSGALVESLYLGRHDSNTLAPFTLCFGCFMLVPAFVAVCIVPVRAVAASRFLRNRQHIATVGRKHCAHNKRACETNQQSLTTMHACAMFNA